MSGLIKNPSVPYIGPVEGGFREGTLLRIQGRTLPDSKRFNINLQTGPEVSPRDDTALHISVRLLEGYVARNTLENGDWGNEEDAGELHIGLDQSFEIIVLSGTSGFKIAINGRHFCEFPQRISASRIHYLSIDGDVDISIISFEGNAMESRSAPSQEHSGAYNPQAQFVQPTAPIDNYGGPQYQQTPPQGQFPGYNPYGSPQPGYGPPPSGYGHPPPPPGAPQEQDSGFENFLGTASSVIAGAISSGMADKLIGSLTGGGQQHPPNQQLPMQQNMQQQPQPNFSLPQLGGGGSVGGLGSLGSLLTGFAEQVLQPRKDGHH